MYELIEIKIPESDEIIALRGDCLESIDDYSLFTGELISDTLIIKN